ncbi:MAG: NCS1 family nucleobase:cation symporter-1 [Myxococcota bacterium]
MLTNPDLAPTSADRRTWNVWHIAALWVGMAVCIPTYTLASSLIDGGMNWWQAVLTIALGNVVVLFPMVLNAHAGTKYGIPFPVFARASFGVLGANLPALLRAVVACGWFGIQTWIGGEAVNAMLQALSPGTFGAAAPWVCFGLFWLINVYFIWAGTESIKWMETLAAPFLIVTGLAMLAWAWHGAGGFGPILGRPARLQGGAFWAFFFPSLTAMVGYWATLSLNIPDFTRFARSQRDQILGQAIGLPTTMTLFAFIGVAVTSATPILFGRIIWNPVEVLAQIHHPVVIVLAMIALAVATLSTNIAANVVSPANDFSNLAPRWVSFRTGGLITAVIGIAIMPWKLYADPSGYIFTWLIGYSALLGPIGGVLIADYFVLRRRTLVVEDLYRRGGVYEYAGGVNPRAVAALLLGVAPSVPGFLANIGVASSVAAPWRSLYAYAWFVGFAVSASSYLAFMRLASRPDDAAAPA